MEHEHINDKNVALSIRGVKLTGRLLAQAMQAFLKKAREPTQKHGKQSMRSLSKSGASLADIDIGDKKSIRSFNRIAQKYKIDFTPKIDRSCDPPKWVVWFKAKDSKSLESAFKEYSKIELKRKDKPPMLKQLEKFKALAKLIVPPAKNRSKGEREL